MTKGKKVLFGLGFLLLVVTKVHSQEELDIWYEDVEISDSDYEEIYYEDGSIYDPATYASPITAEQATKEREERMARQAKQDKYNRIFNACLLDKSSDVDMQVGSIENAVREVCGSIAIDPSWLEKFKYD